ncbi:MAG: Dihydrofolate reductase [Candidatus Gottesmanbacteria bacterium GW2011_GWB1_44_11c]|uniref:Dihydrofolate reductase n=2 Tax=Candidatus Gottesmaniibacteriota TaxID=1752720 RepID=A0A0G1IIR1_9BACT|nr:MAG: Dihydrofolate reductase [Candidatus Gottesmanbacteria bacterium GW2011_GWB1_44_11c]KKT59251.1 MAG: Dihydrofolate reductase [Candidatus Gottesmanbacteria bacterium GW2011_GWA1_44_24b]HCM82369.1 diacylglycerol kinase [Patescibacteria group bacterium]
MNSKLSVIAVVGKNRELGKNNKLLWDIPEDMAWFKEITKGHPVIMGKNTFLSIGHPLPHRVNIVITRDPLFQEAGVTIAHSFEEAINIGKATGNNELFIIGGAKLYSQAVPIADKLYITKVDALRPDADTFFPEYESRFTKKEYEKTIHSSSGYTITFSILTPS